MVRNHVSIGIMTPSYSDFARGIVQGVEQYIATQGCDWRIHHLQPWRWRGADPATAPILLTDQGR